MQGKENIKKAFDGLSLSDYYTLFCFVLLIGGVLYSTFIFTLALVAIVIRILFIGSIKDKLTTIKQNKILLICLIGLYILNIIGLIWTDNLPKGLTELNHKLPLLIIPLFIAVISPLKRNVYYIAFAFYLLMLTFGIIYGFINYIIHPYTESRVLIPFARHISFAFHLSFASAAMIILSYKNRRMAKYFIPITVLFLSYIFIASLASGVITVTVLAVLSSFILLFRLRSKYACIISIMVLAGCLSAGYWFYRQYCNYFVPKEDFAVMSVSKTSNGNDYRKTYDRFIENGNYVNKYCCPEEVNAAWKNRTGLDITDYCIGKEGNVHYHYYDIIYRYLNSKGLKKDAQGVNSLTQKDIENIKQGCSNIVYTDKFSLKPRLYQTFYEFERYFRTKEVENMSLIQRIVWTENTLKVIKDRPVKGTGTGAAKDCMDRYLKISHPEIQMPINDPHNQFLYTTANFGLIGLAVLLIFLLYPMFRLHLGNNPYFTVFFITALCWMFAESCLERYDGMCFVSTLMSFFCFNQIADKNKTPFQ
ncbi:MAG: O-antigen ligase family protein [Bacteroidales bacterium]|nr:O-antigen ligase family protein [Bacteroidales bacterium]